jgi:hypothetical protein
VNVTPSNQLDKDARKQIRSKASKYAYDKARERLPPGSSRLIKSFQTEKSKQMRRFRLGSGGLQEQNPKPRRKYPPQPRNLKTGKPVPHETAACDRDFEGIVPESKETEGEHQLDKTTQDTLSIFLTQTLALSLGASSLDPLNALPATCCPRDRLMVHHYCKSSGKSTTRFEYNLKSDLRSTSLSNPSSI